MNDGHSSNTQDKPKRKASKMVDKTLNGKLKEWDALRKQIEPLQSKMDDIKGEVKTEMQERKIDTYSYSTLKVDMVCRVTQGIDKKKLIAFLATTKKYQGCSEIPADFLGDKKVSEYPQLKENK